MVKIIDLDKVPIGIYEKALPAEMTWAGRLRAAKEAGYDYLELSIDESDQRLARLDWGPKQLREFREIIAETEMPVLSMCLSAHRRFPLGSEDKAIRDAGLEIMRKALCFALATGIRVIQLAGYDEYDRESNKSTREHFMRNLRQSVVWASRVGVTLAIEVMDHPFINSVHKAMEIIKEIDSPWLHVYPDIGNLSAWGLDVPDELRCGARRTVAIHVKDTKPGVFKRVPFGDGNVDFTACFKVLSELNYPGPLLVEMWSEAASDPIAEIAKARKWISDQMAKGGILCSKN